MSDLKAMRRRADLAVREGANVVLLPEQYAALIACAEALQDMNPRLNWNDGVTARKALAQLEAAP